MFRARGTRVLFFGGELAPDHAPIPAGPVTTGRLESVVDHRQIEPEQAVKPFDLPFDFLDQVRSARAGDPGALALMREFGATVPENLQVAFLAYVQDQLGE